MELKINKMTGLRTVDESRDIPDDKAFAIANVIVEDGQMRTRPGFDKVNTTKFGAPINGLYDYRGRVGVHMPIIGSDGSVYRYLSHYTVVADDPITIDTAFTLTITAINVFGARDYSYNGTANLTENGAGSLSIASLTFVQGVATTAAIIYTGGAAGNLTITATDSTDSTVFGSDTVAVQANPWSLLYTHVLRGGATLRTQTPPSGVSAVFGSKLYFISSAVPDVDFVYGDIHDYIDVISVDAGNNYTAEYSIADTSTSLGMCIGAFASKCFAGTGIMGKMFFSTDGSDFSNVIDVSASGVNTIYAFESYGGKYYAGTGYGGVIIDSSDGLTWAVAHTLDRGIMRFALFGPDLYFATSIGKSGLGGSPHIGKFNGTAWTDDCLTGALTQFFGLCVFGGYLYAGEHDDTSVTGGVIYRSNNGTDWTLVCSINEDFPYVMCVVGSRLYVGCADGALFYTDNGTDWSSAVSPTTEDIFGLAYWNSTLFVTTTNKIYSYTGS